MTPQRLQAAVDKGLTFLASVQAADGSFESFSSPVRTPFDAAITYRTTFAPALILSAIAGLHDSRAQAVSNKLAAWLLAQRSPHWSFNYWAADAPERRSLPYPDDLDDTFCALIALYRHDPTLVDQSALAHVVKLLIAAESKVGGPYRTWLAAPDAAKIWKDIDLAVNANINGFLRLVADPLPNIAKLIERAIASRKFASPYYPSAYSVIYFIARAYDGPQAPRLAGYLIDRRHDEWQDSPLAASLAVASLVRLGRKDACGGALERLLASQQPDGSWPAEAFCIDPAVQNKTHYGGGAALTTAFALEALASFCPPPKPAAPKTKTDATANAVYRRIMASIRQDATHFEPSLRRQIQAALERTHANDKDRNITLLPYFFNQSLAVPLPTPSDNLLARLGAANMYGWTAYTAYDDFLDGEGRPQLLSAANAALRYSLRHFRQALPEDAAFQAYTNQIFNTVDSANTWELTHCRMAVTTKTITIGKPPGYPDTLKLADRSIGHTLTPLAVLAAAGVPPTDRRARHISLALRHYIAARQLNDDLHDWEKDLHAGIITYVVARLLKESAIAPGTHTFVRLIPKLQRRFWHHTLLAVCSVITRHTGLARRHARASTLLAEPNLITRLTQKIDDSVEHTRREQSGAEAFLAAYNS